MRPRRLRILVLSHVLPFPGHAGQQQRVRYTLQSLRPWFHVTFLTYSTANAAEGTRKELKSHCDESIVLPFSAKRNAMTSLYHTGVSAAYQIRTGLKQSNYFIQREFAPDRLEGAINPSDYDCVLFEYWHAASSTSIFRAAGTKCLLDMHDILWRARERQLAEMPLPQAVRSWLLRRYQDAEEKSWRLFDGIIAINREELEYATARVPASAAAFYMPMGVDLSKWPYRWDPAVPPRLAYYGGLSSPRNQKAALESLRDIMPAVWRMHPAAEFWIVGSNPPPSFQALTSDPRVKVTGFVDDVQSILCTMTAVLCPWVGTYGFRSRLIEVMALGVPVVAMPDAVAGMEFIEERGLLLRKTPKQLAEAALELLGNPVLAHQHSLDARSQAEGKFSFEATYGKSSEELLEWLSPQSSASANAARASQ